VKVFATFVLVLAALVPTRADTTQTWDVTASCTTADGVACPDPANISAVFTTELITQIYVDPSGSEEPTLETEMAVMGFQGTYDGQPMSGAAYGCIPFLQPGGSPECTSFIAGGEQYVLNTLGYTLLEGDTAANVGLFETLNWSAVEVPEPPLFWLLLTALLLLVLMRWAQMSLRKLSGR
jgi:hypothetical protein